MEGMKAIVKWNDLKRVGVPRRLWRRAKSRMKPMPGSDRLYRAEDAARVLGLPLELFERMR
jgi:uncharacterized protein (DUF2384 family)